MRIKMTPLQKFRAHSNTLVLKFASQKAADHFKSWLCGSGEQAYWNWMECREQEEKGPITALNFDYHTGTDEISTKCGRLDEGVFLKELEEEEKT
jgi:hypothetical protein